MINDYCGFCNDAFSTLLDAYQMKDWGMTWENFIGQAWKEFTNCANEWAKEPIGEGDEG